VHLLVAGKRLAASVKFCVALGAEQKKIVGLISAAMLNGDDVMHFQHQCRAEYGKVAATPKAGPAKIAHRRWQIRDQLGIGLSTRPLDVFGLWQPDKTVFGAYNPAPVRDLTAISLQRVRALRQLSAASICSRLPKPQPAAAPAFHSLRITGSM